MMESEQTAELAAALAKAQAAMGPAIINRVNPHFKNRYADLAAVFTAIKPMHDNGLSFTQTTQFRDGVFLLRTTLRHTSGQWIASEHPLPLNAKPQELGSALTYAKRYSLSAMVGVAADEDDDGEATRKTNGNNGHAEVAKVDRLSQTQIDFLRSAIVEVGADIKKFCAHMKVERVEDIPVDRLEDANTALANFRANRGPMAGKQ